MNTNIGDLGWKKRGFILSQELCLFRNQCIKKTLNRQLESVKEQGKQKKGEILKAF